MNFAEQLNFYCENGRLGRKICKKCGAPITMNNVQWHSPGKARNVCGPCRKAQADLRPKKEVSVAPALPPWYNKNT